MIRETLEKNLSSELTTIGAFLELERAVWLDSNRASNHDDAATSIITALPSAYWQMNDAESQESLKQKLRAMLTPPPAGHQRASGGAFKGGIIGMLGYEATSALPTLSKLIDAPDGCPEACFGRYDWYIELLHDRDTARLVILHSCPESIRGQVLDLWNSPPQVSEPAFRLTASWQAMTSKTEYQQAFDRILDYLHAGDCYQVNLCQAYRSRFEGSPLAAYLALRQTSPVPFAAYMKTGECHILSLSPERFISLRGRTIRTSPIKGTAPTHTETALSQQAAERLAQSPKDRAENLMIVDLLRNDISQFAETGSVSVPSLFRVETFRQVHHLVSTIEGTLADGKDAVDLLVGCFPGGSITGAPKKRAMEIINELEKTPRSAYCGSIFYINDDGDMDSSITIRTLVCDRKNDIYAWAGGGITAASRCDEEYAECNHKIGALLRTLEQL